MNKMLYAFVKLWVRSGLLLYCRKIIVQGSRHMPGDGPLIIAANHPNSFFDALIIACVSPRPLHFLARGDAFKKPAVARILRALQLIPIYRLSEGKEFLSRNEESFDACLEVLRNNGAVLIFPEGICVNEWKLRPLRKGTARLAFKAWHEHHLAQMKVLPLGLSYQSFHSLPKTVWVKEAPPFQKHEVIADNAPGFYGQFNSVLRQQLLPLVLLRDDNKDVAIAGPSNRRLRSLLLALPAFAGYLLHRWYYLQLKDLAAKKTAGTVFYDSVLFALLLLSYPVIVLLVTLIAAGIGGKPFLALFLIIPFTAWCYKSWKGLAQ